MPLETPITYISDLNPANPTVADGLNQGDDHLRGIKAALKATFASITGALASSHTSIDSAVGKVLTTGADLLASTAAFHGNPGDNLSNPVAGEVDVNAGSNIVAKFKSDKSAAFQGAVSTAGSLSSTGPISGPGVVPIGGTVIWWADTLPDANWLWANGGWYSRSNATLWALFGTRYGTGDGTTTANLPDLRDRVPVAKGTMGGTAALGVLTHNDTSALGNKFGEEQHLLTQAEMPAHTHTATVTDPQHSHALLDSQVQGYSAGVGTAAMGFGSGAAAGPTQPSATGITVANSSTGGSAAHNIVQPALVCNWIIRVA